MSERTLGRNAALQNASTWSGVSQSSAISWLTLATEMASARAMAEMPTISPARSCCAHPWTFAYVARTCSLGDSEMGDSIARSGCWNGLKIEGTVFERPAGKASPTIRSKYRPRPRFAQPFYRFRPGFRQRSRVCFCLNPNALQNFMQLSQNFGQRVHRGQNSHFPVVL